MTTLIECSIDFFNEKEVDININCLNKYTLDFLAIFLFSSYTFRQAINIGINHPVVLSLGKTLSEILESKTRHTFAVVPTNSQIEGGNTALRYISIEDDIKFVSHVDSSPKKLGKKRFVSKLVTDNGITKLLLEPIGFGLLGEGINYYAPTSVFVLLYCLLNQPIDLQKLGIAARVCGQAIVSGTLTLENQFEYASSITEKVLDIK